MYWSNCILAQKLRNALTAMAKVPHVCRLPISHAVCESEALWKRALADIVKTRDGFQRTPLMAGIGAAEFVNDITEAELLAAVRAVRARAVEHPVSHMHAAMAPEPFVMQPHVDALRGERPVSTLPAHISSGRRRAPAMLV